MRRKVSLISLGCSKNLVDSEVMLGQLGKEGYVLTDTPQKADIIVINTCSFIEEARQESRQFISKIISSKDSEQKVIVCGCLAQLEKRVLFSKYPQVDAILGSADFHKIKEVIQKTVQGQKRLFEVNPPNFLPDSSYPRLLSTPPSYAYLKISEGCSNHCSYCRIPSLRGEYRSRDLNDLLAEAKTLAKLGSKELILIAQDTTFYGEDKGKRLLIPLLRRLQDISFKWIRLLYTHPAHFSQELVHSMAKLENFCHYVDIPIQHTHDEILRMMRRPRFKQIKQVIQQLRECMPDIALRTTVMVGFPGEREKHFRKLLKDIEQIRFDWLGAFPYSPEKGTEASSLSSQVSAAVKKKRYKEIMELQRRITSSKNEEKVGKIYPVLVDKQGEGHTEHQAPELDGKVFLPEDISPGEMFSAKIINTEGPYDLKACVEHQ